MREQIEKIIVTFDTIADAMNMEKICKNEGIEGRLIPTPRTLSAGCGISWCSTSVFEKSLREIIENAEKKYEPIDGEVVKIIN